MLRILSGRRALALVSAFVAFAATPAQGAIVPTGFTDELVASGFALVSNFDFLPDGRVLVVEQPTARIRLVAPGQVGVPDSVGTVPDVQVGAGEAGLLGIAIDPRWPEKPYVYVHFTASSSPNIKVRRYALTGDLDGTLGTGLTLDLDSARDILADLPDDFLLHNGGTLLFAPDSMLIVALGDDNVPCSSQDLNVLRGKLLRLNVLNVPDGGGWAPDYATITPADNPFSTNPDPRTRLVWQFGLRNPWTFDIDPSTGMLAIADVGNDSYEEINLTTLGGRNFGWPLYEGPWRFDYPLCTYPDTATLTAPSAWYPHPTAATAIILGGIARWMPTGLTNFPPEYMGNVFYSDLYDGVLRRLVCVDGKCAPADPVEGQPTPEAWATGLGAPTRMRFGPDGALWYANFAQGELRKIVPDLALPVPALASSAPLQLLAFPVPAVDRIRLSYRLPAAGRAVVLVHDVRGRIVRTLVAEGDHAAGEHVATWDGADDRGARVPAGVYFGAVTAGGRTESRRLLLLGAR
jgi:glucose/arabinose dehydrogenase